MKKYIKLFAVGLLAAIAVGCSKVPAGHVGVKVYLLGGEKGVDSVELGVGRYWIGVNEELYLFPTFSQNFVWTKGEDPGSTGDESISFQTKEGMEVSADIGITYSINPGKVTDIFQKYRKGIDEITDVYLRNMVRDALVTEAGSKSVEAVYGEGKADIIARVQERVRQQVEPFGINIERIYWIGAVRLPRAMTTALNAKLQATQMAEQRRNEIEQAKAEAEKERQRAQGEADAKLIVARADADAIKLKAEALRANSDVATLNAIEKWNGVMPTFMGADGAMPFIQIK
jgi:regulator of protease activity HflC (stomatin/prohibitin superfamily)